MLNKDQKDLQTLKLVRSFGWICTVILMLIGYCSAGPIGAFFMFLLDLPSEITIRIKIAVLEEKIASQNEWQDVDVSELL